MPGAAVERVPRSRGAGGAGGCVVALLSSALAACAPATTSPPAPDPPPQATPEPPTQPTPPPPAAPAPVATPGAPSPSAALPPGYQLVWQDEFEGATLDPARWRILGGPRGVAVRGADSLVVQGGVARFVTYTDAAGVHRTGFISTEGLFEALRGYFEARIRFTGSPGEWCAFWLFAPTVGVPLGDPATAGTEIDVVEHRVTDESGWQLADWVGQNVLWDGYGKDRKNVHHVAPAPGGAAVQGQWHTFAVLWDELGYTFYVDSTPVWTTAQAVSQRTEYLLLTCEVLQADWAGFIPTGGYGPLEASVTGMEVDWVRVWQRAP